MNNNLNKLLKSIYNKTLYNYYKTYKSYNKKFKPKKTS